MLSLTNVVFTLPDGRRLLDGVEATFEAGSVNVVVGPSGTGKSTLLSVAASLLQPDSGSVERCPSAMSDIAWVLQGTNQLGHRTVEDNATIYSRFGRKAPSAESTASTLAALGLAGMSSTKASRLSGGEVQRLAVARAVLSRRPFIFADEPTSQLDRSNALVAMQMLAKCAETGGVVLIVTHDRDAIPAHARVFRLANGVLSGESP